MLAWKTGSPEFAAPASDQAELLYRKLLVSSYEEREQAASRRKREKRTEMKDYYTMWVHQVKTPIAAMNLILPDRGGAGSWPAFHRTF